MIQPIGKRVTIKSLSALSDKDQGTKHGHQDKTGLIKAVDEDEPIYLVKFSEKPADAVWCYSDEISLREENLKLL